MIAYARPVVPARYPIKEWPTAERPRERLESVGAAALSPRELLALLVATGVPAADGHPARSALDVAGALLRAFAPPEGGESLRRIMTAPFSALCAVPGIGPAKAARIVAALELGRRAAGEARSGRDRLATPRDVYERLRLALRDLPQEVFHALLLNTQGELLRDVEIASGTVDGALVHPRDVFRPAVAESAASVILVHNHPSGEAWPSAEDVAVTDRIVSAGHTIGIEVLDHVVIGEGRYVSFVEAGLMLDPAAVAEGRAQVRRPRPLAGAAGTAWNARPPAARVRAA
ncbi:MAG TPA: DNA repair protein RadC [Longimicrobiaceae bacterium]|nr:DNA repair protein RadC [Longimicrobiaceae bacterium]